MLGCFGRKLISATDQFSGAFLCHSRSVLDSFPAKGLDDATKIP